MAASAISKSSSAGDEDPLPRVFPPATLPDIGQETQSAVICLKDGTVYQGYSFGAAKSICGECVFQTGMVGYTESLTDPSYRGQILVLTFPLIGNYGVPSLAEVEKSLNNLPKYFESEKIQIAGLIVGKYSDDYSHFLAKSSLSKWLKDSGVPALAGIDTRMLTKKIRSMGVMLGKILFPVSGIVDFLPAQLQTTAAVNKWMQQFHQVSWVDPNLTNLVAEVSTKHIQEYKADAKHAIKTSDGRTLRVLAVDVGMKYNQIRCFINRGVDVQVVPWDFNFNIAANIDFDGLFISNGPGDPTNCGPLINRLSAFLKSELCPVFGICLGHQLMALAAGAKTKKMKFGNRGHNIPCLDKQTGRCYITSQNHGYAVDTETLPAGWQELFVNANDGSNEGIIHETLPYFSVQFHPESTPGPRDTEYLFDRFIHAVQAFEKSRKMISLPVSGPICTSQRVSVNKVLILGSGGLSIGQAGEFDYSGSQAIKALKEEGIYTVLINPNIATIQTSKGLADKVYFLPVTPDFVRKVIKYEKPDGIYVSFGGQTALNCGVKMKDEFEGLGVRVLGTPIETVIITEDRELFANKMAEINEKCAESASATTVKEAVAAAKKIGYPVIARAAYALGGLGSGFASNEAELAALCNKAFAVSPQVLVEKSMKGWKEIEYEVVRDINNNCITVCNMENFDPLGIHTGDSIVVAPSQTLSDEDYNMLRTTAVNVIRHLGVVGECNIQYALNPDSKEYCIIEVNARLSRSSALASKATGYPLAFVAAKLGLGIPLSELKNNVTKVTCACFEPSLDYCVVKIPRWDLKKFNRVSTKVGSSMKSVGEVMAIGRNFEEAIQKAIRSVDYHFEGFAQNQFVSQADIEEELKNPSDKRLFAIANTLHSGKFSVDEIWRITKIDKWFLHKLNNIVKLDRRIREFTPQTLPVGIVKHAKQLGFCDRQLAHLLSTSEMAIRKIRQEMGVRPFVKQIDTVAAEFPSFTNYLYMTYNAVENDVEFKEHGVLVVGSGVYRIGSSVEFDWCAVRTVRTLRQNGFKTIMINYNPETVSTDYDEADRLYFENITVEKVMDIYELEGSAGVIVSMGGQTPNNISLPLHRENVKIFGTSPEQIDGAENRYKFSRMCDSIGVDQPQWKELTSMDEARVFCDRVGFPVLVRPSYVLSGAAMNVVYSPEDLENYLLQAVAVSKEYPVVISKFIEEAKEIEMDAVAKDGELIFHVISEHVENAGVHSGDATLVLPPQDLQPETIRKIEIATAKIGKALNVTGPFNIQFIAKNNEIKVIECNVRASRSFPFVSKVLGVDLIELATKAMMDLPFESYPKLNIPKTGYVCIKVPQFSFSRLSGADPVLGVEMASTGEVACFGKDKYEAYLKALVATGFHLPRKNILLSIGSFKEKQEFLPSVWKLHRSGFNLFATSGTADFISEHGIPVKCLEAFDDSAARQDQKAEYSLTQHLANNLIDLYINLPSRNRYRRPASYMSKGYQTRRMAVDLSVPLMTNVKCAKLLVEALTRGTEFPVSSIDSQTSHQLTSLPGLFTVGLSYEKQSAAKGTETLASSGFTCGLLWPYAVDGTVHVGNADDLLAVRKELENHAASDYILSVAATSDNFAALSQLAQQQDKPILFVRFPDTSSVAALAGGESRCCRSIGDVTRHLKAWPLNSRFIADATGAQLAAILFLAEMHTRSVHVTNVRTADDMELILLSKLKGVRVTCDVSVFSLFMCRDDYSGEHLTSRSDMEALWTNLDSVDCLSTIAPESAVPDALPLLLTAVQQGRLTMQRLQELLVVNPRAIFELGENATPAVAVEIESDRPYKPFVATLNGKLFGRISRVSLRGSACLIDGVLVHGCRPGAEMHSMVIVAATASIPASPLKQPTRRLTGTLSTLSSGRGGMQEDFAPLPATAPEPVNPVTTEIHLNALASRETRLEKAMEKVENQQRLSALSAADRLPSEFPKSLRTSFYRQHILSVNQFTRAELHILFAAAQEMRTVVDKSGSAALLAGKVLCNLFYEPSTRTSVSFETAMLRLGGQVVSVSQSSSSAVKGESLSDTIRTVGAYTDAIVIRHPEKGSASVAAKYSRVPILNAGDGIGEHPTQAFLDVFTIREELGTVNGLTITIIGDLKNGRTVHSLVKLLSLYDVKIHYVSPDSLRMPVDLVNDLRANGLNQTEHNQLTNDLLAVTDVLYVTRVQKERFTSENEYDAVKDSFRISTNTLKSAKAHMIVMHPLPRVAEIDPEVDFDQRAVYFRQMKYGLYVRMALLALVMAK